ncbi:hypothetical protein PT2222_200001 [Paraburkholderia tropica]
MPCRWPRWQESKEIFRHPLRLTSGGANIRPLRCTQQATRRSEARDETSGFAGSASFLSGDVKKDVDETKKRLHNLVSLLLTQQRSKRRVVQRTTVRQSSRAV